MSNDVDSREHEGNVRYTLKGVAFLLKVPPSTIRRWARGYTAKLTYSTVEKPGVLGPDADVDGLFTFPALVELFFVREASEAVGHGRKERRQTGDRKAKTRTDLQTFRNIFALRSALIRWLARNFVRLAVSLYRTSFNLILSNTPTRKMDSIS